MISGRPIDHIPKAGTSVAYTTTRSPGETFIPLAVRAGRDTRLKLAAKGLLWELLTYHDGELPADRDIWEAHRAAREAEGLKSDGIDAIRGALDDLERWGYLVRFQIRDASGQRRSVRALTDSPGHHKLDVLEAYREADQISGKTERLAKMRELLTQQSFPRGGHCPAAQHRSEEASGNVVSLDTHRRRRAG